ncbi:MAG TPA: XRE family transcriptional regulator [Pyrinomonadaceae bacterium]|jgi:Zn-dependent peptidase ImmA (M78 family)/transcriptional regulator with XRE-family HTH domain
MNGDRLKRAREIKGWTQEQMAEAANVSQVAIARIEQNLLKPSEQLAQQIAIATGFPVAFFYQESAVDFPLGSLLFRQHMTLKSRERDQILQTAWVTYVIYDYMAQKLRMMPLRLPRIENEDTQTAALLTRNALGINAEVPVNNLINKLEKAGVVVLAIPLEIYGHDGFSLWADNRRAVIVLSSGKPGDRQRHTTSHEAAHLVLHYALYGSREDIEKEADDFASEFLLPEEAMRREIVKPVTLSSLAELKPRWRVSIASLIERAYKLKIINPDQRKYLWKQMALRGWKTQEPANLRIDPEKPRALRQMAEMLYGNKDGTISYKRLARDTSMPPSLVAQILEAHSPHHTVKAEPPGLIRNFPVKPQMDSDSESALESVG